MRDNEGSRIGAGDLDSDPPNGSKITITAAQPAARLFAKRLF